VVSLLPPGHLKVRFFVSESDYATLKAGDPVRLAVTGRAAPLDARITYLSPQPEYTPPVLYNRENRAKLVFMIEAQPADLAATQDFHPGQPVDVTR
jgi:HlyD family secretion protein